MPLPDTVERWPLDRLRPYDRNPRTHSDEQVARIAASIVEFGFTNPVLAAGDGTVIAGHGRLEAARRLGLDRVPVLVLDHLTPAQRRAYVIADNQLALTSGWNDALLAEELHALNGVGFDLDLLGFDDADLDRLMAPLTEGDTGEDADADAQDSDADAAPDPLADPVSRPGDLWLLGEHRLLCGDSTDAAAVSRLMAGETAALCFTSPPYAQQRDYATGGIRDWDALMGGVFTHLPMAADGQVLVNLGLVHRGGEWQPYWDSWLDWMREAGWKRFGWYVWDQGAALPGDWNGRLGPSFEFVFHFCRQPRKPNKIVPCKYAGEDTHLRADGHSTAMRRADGSVGEWTHAGQPTQTHRIPDNVIRIGRHKARGIEVEHPAVFPVALPEFVMQAYSDAGDVCYEPFSGSGTAIVAAVRTGRRMRAIDLAPAYVDVAVRRWNGLHPDRPARLDGGGAFATVAAARGVSLPEPA